MSVDGVNNNNNTAAITAGSAIVGAAGGGLTAYNMKPWLKDGMPTDSFVKGIKENMMSALPKESKELLETVESIIETVKNCKTVEEFSQATVDSHMKASNGKTLEEFKTILQARVKVAVDTGFEIDDDAKTYMSAIENATDLDGLKKVIKDNVYKSNSDKTVEQLQAVYNKQLALVKECYGFSCAEDIAKDMFENSYDSNAKKLVYKSENISEDGFKAVQKAAKNIQFKSAALWGAVGAAVLGVGGYLVSSMSSKKAQPQSSPAEKALTSTEKSEPPKTEKA